MGTVFLGFLLISVIVTYESNLIRKKYRNRLIRCSAHYIFPCPGGYTENGEIVHY